MRKLRWRAVCGRTACTVRRAGTAKAVPTPIKGKGIVERHYKARKNHPSGQDYYAVPKAFRFEPFDLLQVDKPGAKYQYGAEQTVGSHAAESPSFPYVVRVPSLSQRQESSDIRWNRVLCFCTGSNLLEITVLLCGVKYLSKARISSRYITSKLDFSMEVLLRQIETTRPVIDGSKRVVQVGKLGIANFLEILS